MAKALSESAIEQIRRDGYYFPFPLLSESEAEQLRAHRLRLPSYPADRLRDLYGPLSRTFGIIVARGLRRRC